MTQVIEPPQRDDIERPIRVEDAVRYLVLRWRKLALVFGLIAISLAAVIWAGRTGQVWPVRGTIVLTFRGIEAHQYPTGKPFDYGQIVSPAVVGEAQRLTGLQGIEPFEMAGALSIAPVIPHSVIARWQQQDRQGQARDPYFAKEFQITVSGDRLSRDQKMSLVRGVVEAFRAQMRDVLYVSDFRISDALGAGDAWRRVDPFELPGLLGGALRPMRRATAGLIEIADPQAAPARDVAYAVRFAELHAQLDQYENGPLAALEGITYGAGVTNNRAGMLRTGQQVLADFDQRLEQHRGEAAMLKQTLATVDRPQFMVPNIGGTNRPVEVNTDVIGTLLRNDYYADLIRRSVTSGQTVAELEAARASLLRRLQALRTGSSDPTPEWEQAAQRAVQGFSALRDRYRELVTGYFDVVAGSRVKLKDGPYVDATAQTPVSVIALAILGIAALMALFVVRIQEMVLDVRRVR